ncbi:MAG TPA: alcohol dehydrogenase catalytic domain-containing protein [Geminicoccus sp.]|jgi:propanol-preferring alcohol dehydrogenase|uniref:alcohol dehydrogenase catalytic domain-containing protein n=1 Tax=Geminicoccus sp. TaxID=2024832 RepID=UPI002E37C811|nr:alcohol dehydrogenase catalytic domain-containing protein [Geminicoccus sp.]HEX2526577.1 alcohol dehydrogenase catalytic domain-containing protein [Geminicoccus sp.]
MAATMRAAVLRGFGAPLQIEGVPRPEPRVGQVLVQIEACGLCHTDVHVCAGHTVPQRRGLPLIPGHEGIGRIVEAGAGAEALLGRRVGVPWIHDTCGHCRECLSGFESFCTGQRAHGFDVDGAFAEYVLADARFVAVLGEDMDAFAGAPLMCAGLTALGGVKKAALVPGSVCVIFGCGGLGLYAVQLAARTGAIVVAVDVGADKLDAARRAGADHAVPAERAAEAILDLTGGADACINFAPTTATWATMTKVIRPRGRIVAAALVSDPVPLDQEWLTVTGVTLTGTSVGTRLDMRELLQLHARKPLTIDHRVVGLSRLNEALA